MNDIRSADANDRIHVAAAALVDGDGRILLTRRHDDSHQGGLWEFPGGKLESGETVEQGLHRELHEELGIEIGSCRPLIRIRHAYPDRSVLLDVYRVDGWRGEPQGREGQPLAWVAQDALSDYPMPAADVPIVAALRLPSTYLITPPRIDDTERFINSIGLALDRGVTLFQLRLFDLADDRLRQIGRRVCERCHARGARVLLNGSAEQAAAIGCDGLHLSSAALHAHPHRPVGEGEWLAASCHSADDLRQAARLGADFALLSPVLPTRSHPDADPLGWSRFEGLVDQAALPVYALGGMRPELLETAWQRGAQGIAGIRGLWPDA